MVPAPLLALVPIYFWCLVRPDLMTPAAALMIGMAEDIMSGGAARRLDPGLCADLCPGGAPARQFRRPCRAWPPWSASARPPATACRRRLFHHRRALTGSLPPLAPILGELAMTVLVLYPVDLCGRLDASTTAWSALRGGDI